MIGVAVLELIHRKRNRTAERTCNDWKTPWSTGQQDQEAVPRARRMSADSDGCLHGVVGSCLEQKNEVPLRW